MFGDPNFSIYAGIPFTKPIGSMVEVDSNVTPFMGCKPGTKGLLTSWDILVKYVHVIFLQLHLHFLSQLHGNALVLIPYRKRFDV